jgi:hypothetical protein
MREGRWHAAALAMALATACGGATEQSTAGVRVVLETGAAFAAEPDFSYRLDETIDVALAYWGGTRADLDGKTIVLSDAAYLKGCAPTAVGCYDGETLAVSTRDPSLGSFACVEETALVHEIGHAVLGDRDHEDPRWMEMDTVAEALSGRVGYSADGSTTACLMYVSVWRHPLGTP